MAGKPDGILPVGYYPLDTAEYSTTFQVSDWRYFSKHKINYRVATFKVLAANVLVFGKILATFHCFASTISYGLNGPHMKKFCHAFASSSRTIKSSRLN